MLVPMNDNLDQRLREVCKPNFDTACFQEAVACWNREQAYNGERLTYLEMTLEQRMWVTKRAQQIKEESYEAASQSVV